MLRPALGEQIRKNGRGRAVAMSLKPRSSIPLVGRRADAVVWFDDRGGWSTSSVVHANKPVPFLQEFITAQSDHGRHDKVWTRTLRCVHHVGEDDVPGERPPLGTTRTFPHVLDVPAVKGMTGARSSPDGRESPFADEYLGRLADDIDRHALARERRARDRSTSPSASRHSTSSGHVLGRTQPRGAGLARRLDRTIGRLLDHLDANGRARKLRAGAVGRSRRRRDPGGDPHGGRLSAKEVKDAVEKRAPPGARRWQSRHRRPRELTSISPRRRKSVFESTQRPARRPRCAPRAAGSRAGVPRRRILLSDERTISPPTLPSARQHSATIPDAAAI